MNTHVNIITPALVYNGMAIRDQRDMLSLTDMWKAHGSDAARQPSNWLTSADAKNFIEVLNPGNSGIMSKRGKGGGTFAHWQVALAYAKYLSPEFHMWCNEVVRAHMEGAKQVATLPADILEYIRRTDGISRMLSHKVTEIEKAMHDMVLADGVTAGEVCDLAKVATSYPRGLSGRVSRRLSLFCSRNGEKPRISRLGRVRAQLFPTHLVREWLDIEGRALIRGWIEEKKSQQANLRLIGGRA